MIYPKNFYSYRYDADFIKEMTALLLISLNDLYKSVNESITENEPRIFLRKLNRSQFALVLINSENLNFATNQIKQTMLKQSSSEVSFQLLHAFRKACLIEISILTEKLGYFDKVSPFQTSLPIIP